MKLNNFKVFITRNGDGAITFKKNNIQHKVFITKNNNEVKVIFDRYYIQLNDFKNRHYALAKWIVRDIRNQGYTFRSYAGNHQNIRPVKVKPVYENISRISNRKKNKKIINSEV
jgi:hypothetical protein